MKMEKLLYWMNSLFLKKNQLLFMLILTMGMGIYVVLGLYSEYWLGVLTKHLLGSDFSIYYRAYLEARSGGSPYFPYHIGRSFVYPPFALTFIGCFSWHGVQEIALYCWSVVSAMAWFVSICIALYLVPSRSAKASITLSLGRISFLSSIFICFAPFWETLHVGQVNTFVNLFLLLTLYFSEEDKTALSGLFLALAALLKISPLIFVLYFMVMRKYRVVVVALISLVVFSVISYIQFGPSVFRDFLGILPQLGSEIHPSLYNESILSIIYRILKTIGVSNFEKNLILYHKIAFIALTCFFLGASACNPIESDRLRILLFMLLIMLMTIFSPLVWYHHNVFLLLPLIFLIHHCARPCFITGIGLIFLIQVERMFEYSIIRVHEVGTALLGLPVFLAQLTLISIVAVIYFRRLSGEKTI